MVISLISTSFRHAPLIYLTFRVLFVKLCSLMFCLDSSVPEDVPRCSVSTLALLASFINSVVISDKSTSDDDEDTGIGKEGVEVIE